ncbi:MAG TPA: UvrD-helicase domain-containing protein [Spirochaetota bacterium]|nr:UvrD-helicase domain-containing protein [Spirochaetota bacterium]
MNATRIRKELQQLLNKKQYQAATTVNGPLLILAGAGSGKTRVITYRTVYMLSRGIPAANILCLTFTNKAAGEMKERIKEIIGTGEKIPRISTFHSFCLWILKKHINHLGFKHKFNIYNNADQKQLIFDILREKDIEPKDKMIEEIKNYISNCKNNNLLPAEITPESAQDRALTSLYAQYQNNLQQYNALDFDDMLLLCIRLFNKKKELLKRYGHKFKYIMIDEYQDTNHAQYQLALMLSKTHKNLAVVGDDDQSIYGWRGADFTNILNFEKDNPGAEVIKLEKNYRSTSFILKAANAVIKNNNDRKEKILEAIKGSGEIINTIEADNPLEEAKMIADDIGLKCLQYNRKYRNFAVLFRTNSQSKPLETMLQQAGIPYNSPNSFNFYEYKEIKDCLAYLKLLNNYNDDISLLRIINYPRRAVGIKTITNIRSTAFKKDISLFQALPLVAASNTLKKETAAELKHFIELIKNYSNAMQGKEMAEVFKDFLTNTGFYDELYKSKKKPLVIQKKIENIDMLIQNIDEYCKKRKNPALHDYLLQLAIMLSKPEESELDTAENKVQLSTIHSAKGLEYKYLYIAGFEENILPFVRDENTSVNINEERRLCYVAITRAQKELTFTLCRERKTYEGTVANEPSRFLIEIPDSCINRNYSKFKKATSDVKKSEAVSKLGLARLKSMFDNN